MRCDEYPRNLTHEQIRNASKGSRSCGFCGRRWAQALDISDDDDDTDPPSSSRRSISTSGYATSEGRAIPTHVMPRSRSSSSSTSDRMNNFYHHHKAAVAATKQPKEASVFDSKYGLNIRVQQLHSEGVLRRGGLFEAKKTREISQLACPSRSIASNSL